MDEMNNQEWLKEIQRKIDAIQPSSEPDKPDQFSVGLAVFSALVLAFVMILMVFIVLDIAWTWLVLVAGLFLLALFTGSVEED